MQMTGLIDLRKEYCYGQKMFFEGDDCVDTFYEFYKSRI